eukprot:CAMPEP_0170481590 /NCGR_PEP_ID=MMETSP0208-20121228/1978_1 /TAXON_ID=197538 /ORGANISM="Strombidium inclinatum, Strain S3" /LENGTH=105 /DNA_ID=CAMNT_0010754325 /DNA_START=1610 /DNA_END=1927 /DNA_ORIENTATION=+
MTKGNDNLKNFDLYGRTMGSTMKKEGSRNDTTLKKKITEGYGEVDPFKKRNTTTTTPVRVSMANTAFEATKKPGEEDHETEIDQILGEISDNEVTYLEKKGSIQA